MENVDFNGACIDHAHMHICPSIIDFGQNLRGSNMIEIMHYSD